MDLVILISSIILLSVCLYIAKNKTVEPFYRTLKGTNDPSYQCKSIQDFDYVAQKKERKYGVPLGCQRMF